MKTIDPAKIDALTDLIDKAASKLNSPAKPEREEYEDSEKKECVCSCCGASCGECCNDGEDESSELE